MINYNELLSELLKLEELGNHGLLKGIDGNEFDKKMRMLDISNDNTIDFVTKAKFEQRQNKIYTLYTTRNGMMGSEFLGEWKEFLEIFCGNTYSKKQTYFSSESEDKILDELGKLFKSAKGYIGMYDNYFSEVFLSLFTANLNPLKIEIISNVKIQNLDEIVKAFKLLNKNKTIELRKYNFSHDRFYIIDNVVYSLGTSLQKPDRATLLSKLEDKECKKFLDDFNNGWKIAQKTIEL